MKFHRVLLLFPILVLVVGSIAVAQTAPPLINYQGKLTDDLGTPVNGTTIDMHFEIQDGGTPGLNVLWSETHTNVTVTDGIYNVILGSVNPVPDTAVQTVPVYLEIMVEGELLAPRQQLTSVPFAMNAGMLGGNASTEFYSKTDVDTLIASLQTQINANTTNVTNLDTQVTINTTDILTVQDTLDPITTVASGNTATDVIFEGVNVHIRAGNGATDATPNSYGNLIVGYNEMRGIGDERTGSHNVIAGRGLNYSSYGGVVVGLENGISGPYASVTAGYLNQASGPWSSVTGGWLNNATGNYSSVMGGFENTASGARSIIAGGAHNVSDGYCSVVSGGGGNLPEDGNIAFAQYSVAIGGSQNFIGDTLQLDNGIGSRSVILGGYRQLAYGNYSNITAGRDNIAGGNYSSVSAGRENVASGQRSSISGGRNNTASGSNAGIAGGENNVASGKSAFIGGGGGDSLDLGNHAYADYSSIIGGRTNLAGDTTSGTSKGEASTIIGGRLNKTTGDRAVIVGGRSNLAEAGLSVVVGGDSNVASGYDSLICGGMSNRTEGMASFIGGGGGDTVTAGNIAYANLSSIVGGSENVVGDLAGNTTGVQSTIVGGRNNLALGDFTLIGGGGGDTVTSGNYAFSDYSTIIGGASNMTGDSIDPLVGINAVISGGRNNTASGNYSTVGGGGGDLDIDGNNAFGNYTAILGGTMNIAGDTTMTDHAIAEKSTISGGAENNTTGESSAVSGGNLRQAAGQYEWVAGTLSEPN